MGHYKRQNQPYYARPLVTAILIDGGFYRRRAFLAIRLPMSVLPSWLPTAGDIY